MTNSVVQPHHVLTHGVHTGCFGWFRKRGLVKTLIFDKVLPVRKFHNVIWDFSHNVVFLWNLTFSKIDIVKELENGMGQFWPIPPRKLIKVFQFQRVFLYLYFIEIGTFQLQISLYLKLCLNWKGYIEHLWVP